MPAATKPAASLRRRLSTVAARPWRASSWARARPIRPPPRISTGSVPGSALVPVGMVKPFHSDHLRFQALPLDLPAPGDPGAVMLTTCGVPEGVARLGTHAAGRTTGARGLTSPPGQLAEHDGQIVIWITVQGLPFEQSDLGIRIEP